MKRFNEWCDRMDAKLKDFEWREILSILFPFSSFFNRKPKNQFETGKVFKYDVKTGNPIQIRSTKSMSNMEMLYGTDVSRGTNFALDMIKTAIRKEICDDIMKGDFIDWQIQDTPNGTQITGRLIVNKFLN
jgi:translation elongation factor EF-1alpha